MYMYLNIYVCVFVEWEDFRVGAERACSIIELGLIADGRCAMMMISSSSGSWVVDDDHCQTKALKSQQLQAQNEEEFDTQLREKSHHHHHHHYQQQQQLSMPKKVWVVWFLVDHHFACFCLCTFANSEDEEFDSMILEDSVSSLVSCYVCLDYLLLVGTS